MKERKRFAQAKTHELPPQWATPFAPGKQFVIPDEGQYKINRCFDPVHIFKREGVYCKCREYFWPTTDSRSRAINVNDLRA